MQSGFSIIYEDSFVTKCNRDWIISMSGLNISTGRKAKTNNNKTCAPNIERMNFIVFSSLFSK